MNDPNVTTKESIKEARSVLKNLEPRLSSAYANAGVFCPASKANIHSDGTVLVKDVCSSVRVGRVVEIVIHDKVIVN
jgi:LDH2 family malate/lactate/ureidoglycolate dehydrogenase